MKKQLAGMCVILAASAYAHAQSDVFLCVDERGNKEYKNTGTTKGCNRVELPGITTIPAPVKRAPPQQTADARASSEGFPKVDRETQKARDSDRKQILLDEMSAEEKKLAALKSEYKNGEPDRNGNERNYAKYLERTASLKESVERSEKNVEALKRELGNLK